MKPKTLLTGCLLLFGLSLAANASITNALYWPVYNGAISNCAPAFDLNSQTLSMRGTQYSLPAVDQGILYASDIDDPRATKVYYIENDTGLTWSDYHVNVYMDRSFSISNALVSLPPGWSVSITQPVLNGSPAYFGPGEYVGHLTYNAGTYVPNAGQLDFQYDIGFSGSLSYHFADELSPSYVPEPATLTLAGLAGLLFIVQQRKRLRATRR